MNRIDILDEREAPRRLSAAAETFTKVRAGLNAVIFGQDEVVEQTLITLLAGGHGLLIGVPGLAKTKLVETLGIVMGLDAGRVQFTPDLMPSDITGSEVMEESAGGERAFRFIRGPVFTQLLMADEINRASPRTQSALLQAMQEKHVTVAGARHDLPRLFHVLATQNPLEQEGTYPLPEVQLDRFLLQIDVGYPDREAERRMLLATTMGEEKSAAPVCGPDDLLEAQTLVRRIPVGEQVMESILSLVHAARPDSDHESGVQGQIAALQHEADGLSAGLPPLMVEADHLAASVSLGVHGRRRAGMGESFWQFRRYASPDSSSAIDWRQSAKSQHSFVREREWEAAQTVWFWRDASENMSFKSGTVSKRARADLLLLALASLLVRGGERVGFTGMEGSPASSRLALTRIGRAMFASGRSALPPLVPFARGNQLVWFSDFLDEEVFDS